ncbi:MAG: hypothetical protein ACREX4_12780, partial [Gammaproteobacteria bacterium]
TRNRTTRTTSQKGTQLDEQDSESPRATGHRQCDSRITLRRRRRRAADRIMPKGRKTMTEQEKLDLRSHDTADEKQQQLLRVFPEVRTEGKCMRFRAPPDAEIPSAADFFTSSHASPRNRRASTHQYAT